MSIHQPESSLAGWWLRKGWWARTPRSSCAPPPELRMSAEGSLLTSEQPYEHDAAAAFSSAAAPPPPAASRRKRVSLSRQGLTPPPPLPSSLIDKPVFNKPHLHPHNSSSRTHDPALPTTKAPRRPDTASPPPRGQTDKRRTDDTLHAGFCAWPVVAPRALQRDTERLGRTKVSGIDSASRDSFSSLLPTAHTARVPSPWCNP